MSVSSAQGGDEGASRIALVVRNDALTGVDAGLTFSRGDEHGEARELGGNVAVGWARSSNPRLWQRRRSRNVEAGFLGE